MHLYDYEPFTPAAKQRSLGLLTAELKGQKSRSFHTILSSAHTVMKNGKMKKR